MAKKTVAKKKRIVEEETSRGETREKYKTRRMGWKWLALPFLIFFFLTINCFFLAFYGKFDLYLIGCVVVLFFLMKFILDFGIDWDERLDI